MPESSLRSWRKTSAAVDAEIANGQGAAGRLNELLRRKSAAARRVAEIASGAAEDHLRAVNECRPYTTDCLPGKSAWKRRWPV